MLLPAVLPRLGGAWLWLSRLVFAAAFSFALFSATAATWYEAHRSNTSQIWGVPLGLGARIFSPVGQAGWRVVKPFSIEAIASGFHPGDDIVAVNGHTITHLDTITRFIDAHEGHRTVLTLRGTDGKLYRRTLTWHAANIRTWFRGSGLDPWRQTMMRRFTYDLMTLLLVLPATILFLRRPHEIVAAVFATGLCLMSVGSTLEYWVAVGMVDVYRIIDSVPYILILMVACAFPDGRYWPSWTRLSIVVMPLIYAPLVFSVTGYGNFSLLTVPAFLAIIAILVLRYRRLRVGSERQQFRWVTFGIAAGLLTLLLRVALVQVQNALSPAPFSPWVDYSASFVHALGYAIIGAGFAIALLKYRLYDAESLISRSAALTAMTLMLAGVWAGSEKAIEAVLTAMLGQGQEGLAGIVSAAFAVVLITPMHGRVHGWIERRFRNSVWRLKEELPERVALLSQRIGTVALSETVLEQIVRAVRVTRAALVLDQNGSAIVAAHRDVTPQHVQSWMNGARPSDRREEVDEDSQFPFRLALMEDGRCIARLLLGPRPDGTPCNRDEREALGEVAASIARGIATTEAREERDNRMTSVLQALDVRLSSLEARLRAAE